MKRALLFVLVAVLLQMLMLDGFGWLSEAVYGAKPTIGEDRVEPLTFVGLVLGGPCAWLFAAAACYQFLRHARGSRAWPCVLGLGLPVLLVATLVSHVLVCTANGW